jgi:hypothetical protein
MIALRQLFSGSATPVYRWAIRWPLAKWLYDVACYASAAPMPPIGPDRGISSAVRRLSDEGIETFESCEGGAGHAFAEPTIRFRGTPAAGWKAVEVCINYGLPVDSLRRVWSFSYQNEPTGPCWEITFRRRMY